MSINTTALFNDILAEFNQGNNDRTTRLFVRSVNRSLDELSQVTDKATPLGHIGAVDSNITDMSREQEYIIYEGTRFYMIRGGVAPSDPKLAKIVYDDSRDGWEKAKGDYWTKNLNDCQAVESSSIIGLGYLG